LPYEVDLSLNDEPPPYATDLSEIKSQEHVKRALVVVTELARLSDYNLGKRIVKRVKLQGVFSPHQGPAIRHRTGDADRSARWDAEVVVVTDHVSTSFFSLSPTKGPRIRFSASRSAFTPPGWALLRMIDRAPT